MKKEFKQSRLKTTWSRARYFLTLARNRVFNRLDPVIMVIIVNNKCNFNCRYCFGDYYNRKDVDYTTEEIKYLVDELYKMGTRYLNIHGGETLLRKDVGEIVGYIKKKGMYCCLITNGSLVQRNLDQIRDVDNITVSLDGTRENNDINRGVGTYDKALDAIKLMIKENIPLRVQATITKYSMNDIGYLSNLAKELGFTLQFSILYKPLPQAKDFEMTNEEIQKAIDQIIEYKKKGFPIFTSYRSAEYARDWPLDHNEYHFMKEHDLLETPKDFKYIKCYYGKVKMIIEADGTVIPCFTRYDFKPLNWREVGLKKAMQHVRDNRDCITCPTMTHTDHNLLLDLNMKHVGGIILNQIKETLKRK